MEKILIGKITSTHGLKGEVKLMSFAGNPEDIKNYKPILDKDGKEVAIKITSKAQGTNHDIFIASIKGFENINQAESLKNMELFIDKNQLPEIDEDEFYYADLIGLSILDEKDQKIGIVKNIMNYGAGDIIEIEFANPKYKKDNLEMFSFRDDIFPEINLKKGFVRMILPEIAEIK